MRSATHRNQLCAHSADSEIGCVMAALLRSDNAALGDCSDPNAGSGPIPRVTRPSRQLAYTEPDHWDESRRPVEVIVCADKLTTTRISDLARVPFASAEPRTLADSPKSNSAQ